MNLHRVFSGAAYLTMASVIGRLLSVVSFPILTRLLHPEAYGVAALATTLISIFTIIGLFGQDTSYVLAYNDAAHFDREQVDRFYARYCWITGAVMGVAAAGTWTILAHVLHTAASPWVGAFVAIGVAGGIISTFAQVRARLLDRYRTLAFALLASGFLSTLACIAVAWLWRRDEVALMAATTSYWMLVAILPAQGLRNLARRAQLSATQVRRMTAVGLPLIVNAPAFWMISSADRWFLAANTSKADLGIYAVGVTVASLGQMVTNALGSVWTPELFRHLEDGKLRNQDQLSRTLTFMIWLIMTTCFGIALFGDILIRVLAGQAYQQAALYVPSIALAYMFYGISQLIGFGFLLRQKSRTLSAIWLIGMAASLALNAVLVPRWGAQGAALTQCLTFGSILLVTWAAGRFHTPFQPAWSLLAVAGAIYITAIGVIHANDQPTGPLLALSLRGGIALAAVTLSALLVWQWSGFLQQGLAPKVQSLASKGDDV